MLTITVPEAEVFNDETATFSTTDEFVLELEHSLASLSKWESSWCVPFLGSKGHSVEQTLSYVKCMTLNANVPPEVYLHLTESNFNDINEYITAKMTATWFGPSTSKVFNPEIITAEIMYYWMTSLSIPLECEHWHLNRLIAFIQVCNRKNAPEKKSSRADLAARNRDLNAQRRAELKTTG